MKTRAGSAPARLAVLALAVLGAHLVVLDAAPVWHAPGPATRNATQAFVTRQVPMPTVAAVAPEAAAISTPATHPAAPAPRQRVKAHATPPPPAEPTSPAPPPEPQQTAAAPAFEPSAAAMPAADAQTVTAPPTVRLNYEISVERMGFTLRSEAHLTWRHDGTQYEAELEAGGGLYPKRVQRSVGAITPQGLAPLRFSDKSRSETATHFERDKGKIVFSNNRPEAPLDPGTQDRLSVIIQLAGLVATAPARYPAGSSIVLPVAGTSEVDAWLFTVEGEEDLQLPGGAVRALKLQRVPRKPYDVKVELWLAAQQDYAPVRLRLTNPNGETADQRWSGTDRP